MMNSPVDSRYSCRIIDFATPQYSRIELRILPIGMNDLRCNRIDCALDSRSNSEAVTLTLAGGALWSTCVDMPQP